MDLLHTYNDMAGRICKMWRDYSYTVRPYVLTVEAGGKKRCATYRTQEEAEHAAAHFMATGDLPAAAEGSRLRATGATPRQAGVASPTPRSFGGESPRRSSTSSPGTAKTGKPEIHKNAPKTALRPQGGTSTRPAAKNDFATALQRQGGAN